MKTAELLAQLEPVVETSSEEPEAGESHSEDDFWEAIELLELSLKSFDALMRREIDIPEGRKRIIDGLTADIGMFLTNFQTIEEN
jgi:hypothetical protein